MKVIYDYQIFSLQKYGGISRYFYELMNVYYANREVDFNLPIIFSNNENLISAKFSNHKTFFPNLRLGIKNKYTRYLNKKNYNYSIQRISSCDFDLMHPTYYDPYFLNHINRKPYVITIHDMIYELYPDLFPNNNTLIETKKEIINKAAKVITVSNHTKEDLIKFYGIAEEKIVVIHLASSFSVNSSWKNSLQNLPEKYLLFVGSRKSHKNFKIFAESVSLLKPDFEDLFVVCAGGGKFSSSEKILLKSFDIEKKVIHYPVNDAVLPILYNNAMAFIYPSKYEGFGIPIIEAFQCECPVIISNASCFPEVAGDAAEYFDANDPLSIKNSIQKVLNSDKYRNELILKGTSRAKYFSWELTAEKTKIVYESVI